MRGGPPATLLGYERALRVRWSDLVTAIAKNEDPTPSFADGLQVQRVLAAVEASATSAAWARVES